MLSFLYTLIIFPLEQFVELSYVLVYKIFHDRAIATLGISAAVSVCTLPLYFIAEKHQQAEREIQKRLKPEIKNIKSVFSGDEQYMILSAYYRQNHYHPVYALRSSLGLLIQIPFFIAAYSFLSNLESIKGVSFLFIKDLGTPDAILPLIAGTRINLLPVLMTLINCLAGAVYTKGLAVKEKVQLYGMALIFLVLLYNSPAGLVLYWTMNNIFSLVKNCLQKTKHAKRIVYYGLCFCVILLDVYALFIRSGPLLKRLVLVLACSCIFLKPVFVRLYAWLKPRIHAMAISQNSFITQTRTFVLSAAVLFLLAGLVLPGALIASSVQEFSFIEKYTSPFPFIGETMTQAAGIFLFWPLCFYFLFSKKVKDSFTILAFSLCVIALIDTFVFPGNYGFLTPLLQFSEAVEHPFYVTVLNVLLLVIAIVFFLSLAFKRGVGGLVCRSFQLITLISLAGFGIINLAKIQREYSEFASREDRVVAVETPEPLYSFSKEGKNVLVIMLDRGVSGYVPYILDEKPELLESFSGFAYYPNCISFGGYTLFGVPGLFGGYEYTPLEMQRRSSELMVEKHNEALSVLPKIFLENGYAVTVTDPSLANYSWTPDLSIYNEYPEIHAENIIGRYTDYWLRDYNELDTTSALMILRNNLIRFSLFKFAPLVCRRFVYDFGDWFGTMRVGLSRINIDSYAVLDLLPDLTTISGNNINTLTILTNDITHEPVFYRSPDYTPGLLTTVNDDGPFSRERHYHVNMAAFLLLEKWFSFLKENGVYDNTRIIIVSDHGAKIADNFPNNFVLPDGVHLESYNALLLVKDFNASGALVTDSSFMTNADVPALAVDNVITNPENPFTHAPLRSDKENGVTIFTSTLWEPEQHEAYRFRAKGDEWLHVHDSIFDPDNWEKVNY
jgi:YidC/Oxa1 family membrane protein insertase